MNSDSSTIAVIGAGIVGVSTALYLQRDGYRVKLFDRTGPAAGAVQGSAGLLARASVVPVNTPGLVDRLPRLMAQHEGGLFLRWGYLPRMLPWLMAFLRRANARDAEAAATALLPLLIDSLGEHQALAHNTPAMRWIEPSDYLVAYPDREHFEASAWSWQLKKRLGFEWELLSRDALLRFDPFWRDAPINLAVRLNGHGLITDPGRYVRDLSETFLARGGELYIGEVTAIAQRARSVHAVRVHGERIDCDKVVVCAGAWSGPLARQLNLRIPLETERGYHIEVHEPNSSPRCPTMLEHAALVVSPMQGRVRIAGLVELGGLNAPASNAPLEFIREQLRSHMPELSGTGHTDWLGFRPTTPDMLPVIGKITHINGAYVAFGHQHLGLTAGPITGRQIAHLISGRAPKIDLSPYAPGRFGL